MLLKLLIALAPMLFFSDNGSGAGGGGGDDANGGDGGDNTAGADERSGVGDDGGDDSGLKSALEKERKARKSAEKATRDLQRQIDELSNRDKSDEEKATQAVTAAQERAEAAERRLREATGRTAIYDAATKANAISLGAVWALAKDGLEYDEDGEPTNVDTVLAGLQKQEAQLFRHSGGRGDGGAGTETKREVKPGFGRLVNAYETTSKTAAR